MAKDVNIHIKTPGADKAKKDLDHIGQSARRTGAKVNQAGKEGGEGLGKLEQASEKSKGAFGKFKEAITGWAAGLASIAGMIAGITKAIRTNQQAIEEHAQAARKQQTDLMNLQMLGDFFQERPELKQQVQQYAEFGRRDFSEVAQAWYNLRSKGGMLPAQQREGILKQALELGRTEPGASLTGLTDAMLLYAKQTGTTDPNQIQNVIKQTLTEAGSDISGLGQYLPRFLPIGTKAGLSGAESAGLWAFATGQLGEPSEATTALRNTFLSLQGKGTPASQELLSGLGISPEMDFWQKIQGLSRAQAAGRFGAAEAETIAGREGIAMMLSLVSDPTGMMRTVRSVTGAARTRRDLTAESISGLMATDRGAKLAEELRLLDTAIAGAKAGDLEAMEIQRLRREHELMLRRTGAPEVGISLADFLIWSAAGLGMGPEAIEDYILNRGQDTRSQLTGKGLLPAASNYNDYSQHYYPVAGSPADRKIGPRQQPGVQQ